MNYPMGDLSIRHQLNQTNPKAQVTELISNCIAVGGGVTLLFGPEKQRKSYILTQMALCAALGEDFLTLSTKQGKVLYITFEGGKPYLIERIEEMAKALLPNRVDEALGNIGIEDLKGSQLDKSVENIEDLVSRSKPLYLICDPVDLALSGDYSNPIVVRNCMQQLIGLAERNEMGIIASTHARKGGVHGFDDVIGSKLWLAMPATIIQLIKDSLGTRLQFEVRYAPPVRDIPIVFNPLGYFELAEPVLKEGERARAALINALKQGGGNMSLKELRKKAAEEAGVHANTIDSARHKLEQEKIIACGRIRGSAAKGVVLLKDPEKL